MIDVSFQKILDRLDEIDNRLKKLEGAGQVAMSSNEAVAPPVVSTPLAPATPPVASSPSTVLPYAKSKTTFSEAQIGKEWFNKIGAVSIIIGVVLFIGYTFQYLGPIGKIALGYVVSVGLIAAGLFLTKKYRRYADSLLAVGWSIAYFTTFATHYIAASRIIESVNINLMLLCLVSAALAIFSYWYNSEEFSILAVFLGALSAIISPTPFFSLMAITVLIFYTMTVSVAKNWATLGFFSVIVSYLTYWIALTRQGFFFSPQTFPVGALFLIIYFILFVAASVLFNSGTYDRKRYATSLIATNAFAFFVLLMSQLYELYPKSDGVVTALFGAALLSIAAIAYAFLPDKKYLATTYGWLGWGFLTLAIPLQLTGAWIAGAWLVEGAALAIVGLVRNRSSFIYTGMTTLTLFLFRFGLHDMFQTTPVPIFNLTVKSRVIFSIFTILVFGVVAAVWDRYQEKLSKEFKDVVFLPSLIAVGLTMISLLLDGNRNFLSLFFLVLASAVYLVGLVGNRQYFRFVGLLPFIAFGLHWLGFDLSSQELLKQSIFPGLHYRTIISLISAAILYGLYALNQGYLSQLSNDEKTISDFFAVAASIILVVFALIEVNRRLITVVWSIEGTLILAVGFLFRKRVLRLIGMATMLLAILRIFLIDLSFLETVYRIISFIVLGVILMGISFLYTKYKDKILE